MELGVGRHALARAHTFPHASAHLRTRSRDAFPPTHAGTLSHTRVQAQADEHLAGKMPSHGTETCAVVETIVSLAASGGILGDAALFERAERVTYNAMPAATTKDAWARVYLQQSNEIWAVTENPSVL